MLNSPPFNRQRLSSGDCLVDKRRDHQEVLYIVLCTTLVPSDEHTVHIWAVITDELGPIALGLDFVRVCFFSTRAICIQLFFVNFSWLLWLWLSLPERLISTDLLYVSWDLNSARSVTCCVLLMAVLFSSATALSEVVNACICATKGSIELLCNCHQANNGILCAHIVEYWIMACHLDRSHWISAEESDTHHILMIWDTWCCWQRWIFSAFVSKAELNGCHWMVHWQATTTAYIICCHQSETVFLTKLWWGMTQFWLLNKQLYLEILFLPYWAFVKFSIKWCDVLTWFYNADIIASVVHSSWHCYMTKTMYMYMQLITCRSSGPEAQCLNIHIRIYSRCPNLLLNILTDGASTIEAKLGFLMCILWCDFVDIANDQFALSYFDGTLYDQFIAEWLYKLTVQKLVIVIRSLDGSEVIERWQFNVQCDKTNSDNKK